MEEVHYYAVLVTAGPEQVSAVLLEVERAHREGPGSHRVVLQPAEKPPEEAFVKSIAESRETADAVSQGFFKQGIIDKVVQSDGDAEDSGVPARPAGGIYY